MTDRTPILFIAGFGRCGTTMAMTMLDRGGFPVSGPRPAYEVNEMSLLGVNIGWVNAQAGRAVKWVDPMVARINPAALTARPVIIHMMRPATEIAASQVKMAHWMMGIPNDRRTRRAFAADIKAKAGRMDAILQMTGRCYHMSFDWVLAQPKEAAMELADILKMEFGADFDPVAAARVVIPRSPLCAPDMRIEIAAMEAANA